MHICTYTVACTHACVCSPVEDLSLQTMSSP